MPPPTQAPGVVEDPAVGPRSPRLLLRRLGAAGDLSARTAWLLLGAAMAVAAAIILWLNRGLTYTPDELSWFMTSPDMGLDGALQPYGGHLILPTRVLYDATFASVGVGYGPFRVLAAASVVVSVGLFYAWASRRIGRAAALAPCLVLLVFGSDPLHVLTGNAFTVLLAISCGLGALLALDRGDRRGDVLACALLCVGVVSYSVALAFTVGIAVSILLRPDRGRRIWIVVVPVLIYGTWSLWARGSVDAGGGVALANVLIVPVWDFQALGASLGGLVGLGYHFQGSADPGAGDAGPALALLAVVALAWRLRRRPVHPGLWAALAVPLALWASEAVAADNFLSTPDSSHYLFSGAVVVLLVAVEAVRGVRWSRDALVVVWLIAAIGVATNLSLLRHDAKQRRDLVTLQDRALLTALEIAGPSAVPGFDFSGTPAGSDSNVAYTFAGVGNIGGDTAAERYLRASDRYGRLGYSVAELRGQVEPVRVLTDKTLVAALGLKLGPASPATPRGTCRAVAAQGATTTFALPAGAAVLLEGATGPVQVRRFASASAVPIGAPQSGQPAVLRLPRDRAPAVPWTVTVPGTAVRVCASG